MSKTNLVSYQKVPMFIPQFVEAFLAGQVAGETLHQFGAPTHLTTTISVRLLQENADPVFVLGEALQSPDDEFDKEIGLRIADGRASVRRQFTEDVNWITFSLSEAETMVDDFYGREEDGEVMQVSSVKLPISELPLPHGVVNRLKQLLPN